MTPEWIVGTLVTVAIAIIGFVINGYRARIASIEADNKALAAELKDIREKYVRRDDLNGHMATVEKSIDELKDGLKDLTKLVITAMAATEKDR